MRLLKSKQAPVLLLELSSAHSLLGFLFPPSETGWVDADLPLVSSATGGPRHSAAVF